MEEAKRPCDMFPENPMEPLMLEQWREFNRATKCHICFKEFREDDIKVRDHCHYTRSYRGPAHRNCNLRYKIPKYIPIIFHNLSGYDAHLFIKELGNKLDTGKIDVIAENKKKYISFTVDVIVDWYEEGWGKIKEKKTQLRFTNSIRFMASNLDSLSSNIAGVSGMACNECEEEVCEFTHINEDYVAHRKCRNCYSGYSKNQLTVDSILSNFVNLRDNHTDKQFRLLHRREFIHMSTCQVGIRSRKQHYLLRKRFITLT